MQNPPPVDILLADLIRFSTAVQYALTAPEIEWLTRADPAHWSLTEVVCHLRDVEKEVHQPRFQAMLTKEDAFLVGMTPDDWAEARDYQQQDGRLALANFIKEREETAALLRNLEASLWQRTGNHAFFGQTTIHELLYLVVQHDRVHWQQIMRLLPTE